MLSKRQRFLKRSFDIFFACMGILLLIFPILVLILFASLSTKKYGLFKQLRVGRGAKLFTIYKIRTMIHQEDMNFITVKGDQRITRFGAFLRSTHLDELPQLFNILRGDMSFVGPRPDVVGYADKLQGQDSIILTVRPGLTGPATLKFRNEEQLLAKVDNPKYYNDNVLWKQKIEINKKYIKEWAFSKDIVFMLKTIF